MITKLILNQESGPACAPAIVSGIPFTAPAPILPNGSVNANVVIDFSSCMATSRFTASAFITANNGTYTPAESIGH